MRERERESILNSFNLYSSKSMQLASAFLFIFVLPAILLLCLQLFVLYIMTSLFNFMIMFMYSKLYSSFCGNWYTCSNRRLWKYF